MSPVKTEPLPGAALKTEALKWLLAEPSPRVRRVRWLFLRGLALINGVAFVSFALQAHALVGSQGISPARPYLDEVRPYLGLPGLWLNGSDRSLDVLSWGGAALSAGLFFDFCPPLLLGLIWLAYLSIQVLGQDFMGFQWDTLLLETDFLAILLAPMQLLPRHPDRQPGPARGCWLLLQWLLFRLMVESGAAKLLSGDPTWRNLTALTYHYETQPLPTPLAWYAHHLPLAAQEASCLIMLVIELLVPVLLFTPWRRWAFPPLAGLQLLILLTGNYTFFNWLTIALCLSALDDGKPGEPERAAHPLRLAACGFLLWLSLLPFPGVESLHLVNHYGLFAVMTRERPQIILEGSLDGQSWREYVWRYQPQDPARRPPWVAPYQPRLDWQMWFAALGSPENSPWFYALLARLLEGSPEVLSLFAGNPFPEGPPKYVRAVLWRYHFTGPGSSEWWTRERLGLYCDTLERR